MGRYQLGDMHSEVWVFLEAFRPRTGGKKMSLGKKTVASSFCIVLFCVHVCVYAYGYRVHIHSVL